MHVHFETTMVTAFFGVERFLEMLENTKDAKEFRTEGTKKCPSCGIREK